MGGTPLNPDRRFTSRLSTPLPGTTTRPEMLPRRTPASESRRSSAWGLSAPWHLMQRLSKIGLMSRLKSTFSSPCPGEAGLWRSRPTRIPAAKMPERIRLLIRTEFCPCRRAFCSTGKGLIGGGLTIERELSPQISYFSDAGGLFQARLADRCFHQLAKGPPCTPLYGRGRFSRAQRAGLPTLSGQVPAAATKAQP